VLQDSKTHPSAGSAVSVTGLSAKYTPRHGYADGVTVDIRTWPAPAGRTSTATLTGLERPKKAARCAR
jgi:hypothetical protein